MYPGDTVKKAQEIASKFAKSLAYNPEEQKDFFDSLKCLNDRLTHGGKFSPGNNSTIADILILASYSDVEHYDFEIDLFKSFEIIYL